MRPEEYWTGKTVLVTGGNGFLGTAIVRRLVALGAKVHAPQSRHYDLTDQAHTQLMLRKHPADTIIHAAGRVGGIGYARKNPATLYHDNLMMGTHLIEEACRGGFKRLLNIGTLCSYPRDIKTPFREDDFWNGYPEATNAAYGLAKKAVIVQAQAYRQQYGFRASSIVLTNIYGPGDNFNPDSSHVIPALVKKFYDAADSGINTVTLWGTGKCTREFLYVDDAAEAVVLAAQKHDSKDVINIGTGSEISIASLADKIAAAVGYEGEILWNPEMPDGQPRRLLDTSRAMALLGFQAKTSLDAGIMDTVKYYESIVGGVK